MIIYGLHNVYFWHTITEDGNDLEAQTGLRKTSGFNVSTKFICVES